MRFPQFKCPFGGLDQAAFYHYSHGVFDALDKDAIITKIILGEIAGKNQAVHAYDKMIWTVRTGFLTLFFIGWGIILKSIVDNSELSQTNRHRILTAMFLVSVALSISGLIIDQNYMRRKFCVINALDFLLETLLSYNEQAIDSCDQIIEYIQVSGDKKNKKYKLIFKPFL